MSQINICMSDIVSNTSLNDLYIKQGGYNWEQLFDYKDFVIYKDSRVDYYQIRNKHGIYYFNCDKIIHGLKAIDKLYC